MSRRISGGVSRLTSRLDDHVTLLGLIVIGIGAFLAYVAFISTTGPPFQSKYELEVKVPADAPVLREGQAVRIGGKLAGLISEVEPDREDGGATVTANITKTEFRPLPQDTEAYVRVHSIVYETYLELRPGDSGGELANGDLVRVPATSGVDLLEVVQLFDAETRESLRETIVNSGFGVAGRGGELNEALADLAPLSRNLSSQLGAVTREEGAIEGVVRGAAGTVSGLRGTRDDDVQGLIESANASFGVVAGRPEELRQTLELLRPFEDQFLHTAPIAERLLEDVALLAGDLEPSVRSLNGQLPDLNRLFDLGETMRLEVDRIAEVADPVLAAARPVIFGLFPTMTALKPLNADLEVLKATVAPYKPEIAKAGKRLSDATSVGIPEGLASGAPAGRVVPVVTPHPCQNPIPDPGEAETDRC